MADSRLRVSNVGSTPIRQLVVGGCGSEMSFRDNGPGETSAYREVPHGVFRAVAFRYEWDGPSVTQPITDCVGDTPLPGGDYTYRIRFEPFGKRGFVRLDEVFAGP
jgi:hypothetical protein